MRAAAAAAPLRSLPLVVLTRVRPLDLLSDLPLGFSADALERAWAAGQTELVALVPGARQVVATENGHGIQVDQPELVIEAIREVVEAVRDPSSWTVPGPRRPRSRPRPVAGRIPSLRSDPVRRSSYRILQPRLSRRLAVFAAMRKEGHAWR
jgi:hypothetical protein